MKTLKLLLTIAIAHIPIILLLWYILGLCIQNIRHPWPDLH